MSGIKLTSVVKAYDGKSRAVDDLTVEFPEGEFICLLGPSGCGKTTTLRMIAGLEIPDSGEITFGDKVFFSSRTGQFLRPEKRDLGLMFQSYALWPHMTVAKNILFGLDMKRRPADEKAARLAELARLLHLEGLEERYPRELSGGQQQRVALARMLAVNPNLLLLDEPLSNLDASLRLEMRAELKRLHQTLGCTVIFVTHDQLEAMTMATSIAVMNKGRIEQMGSPMEIYRQPTSRFVANFVGSPPMNMLAAGEASAFAAEAARILGVESSGVHSIGIRPEAVKLTDDLAGTSLRARIDTIQPTGADWIIGLVCDGRQLFALAAEEPPARMGGDVGIILRRDGLHAFDKDGTNLTRTS
jgi:iron(III) transport system ATP-binding protein